ncbi:MAG: hypothetical protein Q8O22_07455 [Candidatus Omnitrophota bacterium]|nr:hypothetical protein [Candidatus Omnitrophota bacterium]
MEKEVRRVSVFLRDGTCIAGNIHINPGERVIDFFNDSKEAFIVVTDAEFQGHSHMRSFRLYAGNKIGKKGRSLILLKNAIKFIAES